MVRTRRRALPPAFAAVLAATFAAGPARAEAPSLDARTFQPATDPAAGYSLEPTATAAAGTFGLGAFLHYSHRPVSVRRLDTGDVVARPLEHVAGGDFTAHLGLGSAALGLAIPYVLAQGGDTGLSPRLAASGRAPLSALGDLTIEGKSTLLGYETAGLGLALKTRVLLPTGDTASFAGAGTTRVELRLLAEYHVVVATAHASLGYAASVDRVRWPEVTGPTVGDALPFAAGLRFRPKVLGLDEGDRQLVELAVRGSLPLYPVGPFGTGDPGSAALTPVLLGFSDRIGLGDTKDAFLAGGFDVGLTSALGVPAFRAILSVGWSPRENDADKDGVRDDKDQCPEIPEDRDGFEDADGCPEIDNDDDGVLDRDDACPLDKGVESPGTRNGCPAPDADGDGVPDATDACPKERGVASPDARLAGCAPHDRDGDGIDDRIDKCPDAAEDKDGHADEDGCPDDDDDGDGVPDRADACPKERGEPSSDPTKNGCPVHDRDKDTFVDADDKCPDEPETWNGVDDADGCPDKGGAPLVTLVPKDAPTSVRFAKPFALAKPPEKVRLPDASLTLLRALVSDVARRSGAVITVGVRPASKKAEDEAAAAEDAATVVETLRSLAHDARIANTVAWDAIKGPGVGPVAFGLVEPTSLTNTPTKPAPAKATGPAPPPAAPKTPAPKP